MIVYRIAALLCVLLLSYGQPTSAARPVLTRLLERLKSARAQLHARQAANLTIASNEQFPWLVNVNVNSFLPACVGALVSSQWVLIPARCSEKISRSLNDTRVVAGSVDLLFYFKNNTMQIDQMINHPEFKADKPKENDLSLIKLVRPLAVDNRTIQPACLYKSEEENTKPFDNLVVSTFDFRNVSDRLMLMKSNFSDRSFDTDPYQLDNLQLIMAKGLNHSYCLGTNSLGQLA